MLKLLKRDTTPPGGFRYIDPDTNVPISAFSMRDLVRLSTSHRNANKLPIPENFQAIIEDWICQQMPAGVCVTEGGFIVTSGVQTSFNIIRLTMAAHKIMKAKKRVPTTHDEALRRAAICVVCSKNVPATGCSSCKGVKDIIKSMRSIGAATQYDTKLESCASIGLLNEISIYLDEETLSEISSKRKFPETCWIVKKK